MLSDCVKEIYLGLLKQDISINLIDESDIFYYLDLLAYNAKQKESKDKVTIDQIF